MKRYARIAIAAFMVVVALAATGCGNKTQKAKPDQPAAASKSSKDKVYVALEDDAAVAVIDVQSRKLSRKISLDSDDGESFMAHNVQVAPDGKSVWVTANAMEKSMHGSLIVPAAAAKEDRGKPSQVIIIDPLTDTIAKRIDIGEGLDLAHVELTSDSNMAIATSQKKGIVFILDSKTQEVVKKITLDAGSEPHGVRITPDGKTAYVALVKGKSLAAINTATFEVSLIALNGAAMQTAVTPDGKKVAVTLYDTKKLAIYDTADKTVQEISLPDGSKGPLQLYPTADSRFVYVADQGYYYEQPEGDKIYKVDLQTGQIVAEITGGKAPHGVVVSQDGKYVFVSNLRSKDVSMIDASSDTEIAKIRVGAGPNGISFWSEKLGGAQ